MKEKKTILNWLKDAFAMEKESEEIMEHRLSDVEDQPEIRKKVEEHLDETRSQAERIKNRIEALGGDVSDIKAGVYNLAGFLSARSTGPFSDEAVKNGIADFTQESMEAASYQALAAGAEAVGDEETAELAREIMREELGMAEWLKNRVPMLVRSFLAQQNQEA
ncbi:MAG: DUF892 family protein [Candidatus Saccharibacteria bacterium]